MNNLLKDCMLFRRLLENFSSKSEICISNPFYLLYLYNYLKTINSSYLCLYIYILIIMKIR